MLESFFSFIVHFVSIWGGGYTLCHKAFCVCLSAVGSRGWGWQERVGTPPMALVWCHRSPFLEFGVKAISLVSLCCPPFNKAEITEEFSRSLSFGLLGWGLLVCVRAGAELREAFCFLLDVKKGSLFRQRRGVLHPSPPPGPVLLFPSMTPSISALLTSLRTFPMGIAHP